jgi:hypothetical protein
MGKITCRQARIETTRLILAPIAAKHWQISIVSTPTRGPCASLAQTNGGRAHRAANARRGAQLVPVLPVENVRAGAEFYR